MVVLADNPGNFNGDRCYNESSSSCVDSTEFSDFLSPSVPIIHSSWQVFQAVSSVYRELM